MSKVSKTTSLQYLSNISRKRQGIDIIFCLKIVIKVFYKLIPSLLVTIARHAQSTENKKFAISLQYLKKEGMVEVSYLHACKQPTFLQGDSISFGGHGHSCPKIPKYKNATFPDYSRFPDFFQSFLFPGVVCLNSSLKDLKELKDIYPLYMSCLQY